MKHLSPYKVVLFWSAWLLSGALAAGSGPPATRADNVRETLHGVEIVDPYRWLEDQDSPDTRAWIDAQNRYTRSLLDPLPGRDFLKRRLEELNRVDQVSAPAARAGRYFYIRRAAKQELSTLVMRQGLQGPDQVLVDPHSFSADATVSVSPADVTPDGTLLAYNIRRGGVDEVRVRFLDVNRREYLPDELPRARYFGVSVTPDRSGFYYTRFNKEGPRVYYRAFGQGDASEREIFGKGYGPGKIIFASVTDDGRWLVIHALEGSSAPVTEIFVQDLKSGGPIRAVITGIQARFQGAAGGDWLFVLTNWKAPNGRVLRIDLRKPERENWREIVPEERTAIQDIDLVGGRMVLERLENVQTRLRVHTAEGKFLRELPLPAAGTIRSVTGEWERPEGFYLFASFHVPDVVYRFDVSTGRHEVWSRMKAPLRSEDFEVRQEWFTSKDGTRVPMFLFHRRGLKRDGGSPTLLTGYGGFTVSMTPGYGTMSALWAEMGGILALVNLRGGSEFGEEWHKAGMLDRKQNVFDDFLAAAEHLIANRYTNPRRLAIRGRSNGGLLVGAALTQRPELFQAVLCGYPLLDMVRYHKFLVARFWVPEYGYSDDPAQFKYLHAYSPYHRVKKGEKYPAVLMVTGDSDTRVAPLHGRKMAALLQASTGSGRPVLLRYDTKAGHAGGQSVTRTVEELVDELSFLSWQLDVQPGRAR